jgi:NAD-dependent deacetylase
VVIPLERAREALEASRTTYVLTGAGISTASGIPDFRGPDGVWTKDPEAELRSTYEAWVADPELRRRTWARRVETRDHRPEPNAGHRALVALEELGRLDTLVTQNTDGLHIDAGSDPSRLVEIHGTSRAVACLRCGRREPIEPVLDRVAAGEEVPACLVVVDDGGRHCGGILKSATISFGQSLVAADLERARRAALRCDLLLAVGSTLAVSPISDVVPLAYQRGAVVLIVNRGPTAMDGLAHLRLDGPCEELLPELVGGLSLLD